ncbi:cell division protein FtsA [bacterium]|nr:cell division protein FtsA [bacterium]
MNDAPLIVACDLGTTAFRAVVLEVPVGGRPRVVAGASEPADGFEDGDFVDIKTGSLALARLLRRLQDEANVDIRGFTFNVAGSHLRSVMATGQIPLGQAGREITQRDVDEVMTMARSLTIPFDHRTLTVNPIEFSVDRIGGVREPRGRVGSRLEVKAHLITGSSSVIQNIEHTVDKAGFEPVGHAVDVLAVASCLLSEDERDQGVLLIDVGGDVTQWAALAGGRLLGIGSVPWGGEHLTSDLASGLRIGADAAEEVKRDRGVVLRSLVEEADIDALFDEEDPVETPGLVAAILEPRFEEILSLVKDALGPDLPLASFGAGVVLTGGGSRCRGSRELCEEVFGLPTRSRRLPESVDDLSRLGEGQWASALGLGLWGGGLGPAAATEPETERPPGWIDRLRGLWRRGGRGPSVDPN